MCPTCLEVIRAHAHVTENESIEDRPYPDEEDGYNKVAGSALLCGGSYCADPPQRVVWTRPDGTETIASFLTTSEATRSIAGVLQWDPGIQELMGESPGSMTPDEVVSEYEYNCFSTSGKFVRRTLALRTDTLVPLHEELSHGYIEKVVQEYRMYVDPPASEEDIEGRTLWRVTPSGMGPDYAGSGDTFQAAVLDAVWRVDGLIPLRK